MAPLGPFGSAPRLVVGVSGGADSLATFLLAEHWVRRRGGAVLAAVVDHGLRAGSDAEAAGVVAALRARGFTARLLSLGLLGGSALQARARAARHEALRQAAGEFGAPWLLLGHHQGDQAETLLFRLLRGSGESGLAAMPGFRGSDGVALLRPLLPVPRARLLATVLAAGLQPVSDPSNRDPRFARTRMREAIDRHAGAAEGLSAAAAGFATRRLRREDEVAERLGAAASFRAEGWVRLDAAALGRDAVAARALAALVRSLGGAPYAPASEAVAVLLQRGGGTLGGVCWRGEALFREPAACAPPVPAAAGGCWDGRWRFAARPGADQVGALGEAASLAPPALRRTCPRDVLRSLPALWRGGEVREFPLPEAVFAPHDPVVA
ncbi:tRNA lysidine(34) synthetase TilS [Roseomonas elaeocarpi]|uniref:tRNA(Ile)-lysidine synthase n=1 Tax=Roseomonas elaeocarpi TaxID=907779 RepID=A0ABV6JRW7_9PROT